LARLAGLVELAGWSRLAGLAGLAGLARLARLAEVELPVGGHVTRREVTLPGGRSWCQSEVGLPDRSRVGGQGVTIGKDDWVAIVISLFYPGRVYGVGHGISVDAGYRS